MPNPDKPVITNYKLSIEYIRSYDLCLDPDGMERIDSIGQAGFTGLMAPVK